MRSFLILTRVQLLGLANSLAPVKQSIPRAKRRGRFALVGLGVALLVALAALYLVGIALALTSAGLADAIPALAVLIGSLSGIVFTFLKAHGTLFGYKDFDLVMSLPVSRRVVVLSRAAALLGMAMLLAVADMTPLYVVYFLHVGAAPLPLAFAVASILLAPLAPTALATFAAFAVTALSTRFRHSNLVYITLALGAMLALVFGIYALSFSAGADRQIAVSAVADIAALITEDIADIYPPAAWVTGAVVEGSVLGFVAFAAATIVVTVACIEVMQRFYLRLNAALNSHGNVTRRVTSFAMRAHSPFSAIVIKELRCLVSVPSYAFNCLFGYLFMVAIAVVFAFIGLHDITTSMISMQGAEGFEVDAATISFILERLALVIPWIFGFCGIMCCSTSVACSMEGRAAWLMATAPVPTRRILGAKLASCAVPTAASLLVSVIVLLATGEVGLLGAAEVLLVGFGMFYLWVNVGLHLDARRPNFTWTSAQEVVKRSMPILVNILGGTVCVFALGALCVALLPDSVGVTATHAITLAMGAVAAAAGHALLLATAKRATFYTA